MWVWVSASQFWRETHTKGVRARFPMRPEVDKGRKVQSQEKEEELRRDRAENRPVDRRERERERERG